MKRLQNFLLLFLSIGFFCIVWSQNSVFSISSSDNDPSIYEYRKKLISSVFPEENLSWKENGYYIFFEKNKSLTLFYINDIHEMKIYHFPVQTTSPWLTPDKYTMERQNINFDTSRVINCFEEYKLNDSVFYEFEKLDLESHPYLVIMNKESRMRQRHREDDIILGYKKKDDEYKYFYYRDVSWFKIEGDPYLAFYFNVFVFFEKRVFIMEHGLCQ